MNAAATIQVAIEKLEGLRTTAFAGEWKAFNSGVQGGDHAYVVANDEAIAYISANDGYDEEFRAPTADLIVTLHRTIDAQLAILRDFQDRYSEYGRVDGWVPASPTARNQLDLARAILGEAS